MLPRRDSASATADVMLCFASHIESNRNRLASDGFNLALNLCERFDVPAGHGYVGSRVGQDTGEAFAKAAARAGHQGCFSGEIEKIVHHEFAIPGSSTTFINPGSRR